MPDDYSNYPQQSLEQQAIGGGQNKQQLSNFMTALKNVGAGSNNTFMNQGLGTQQQAPQLIDQSAFPMSLQGYRQPAPQSPIGSPLPPFSFGNVVPYQSTAASGGAAPQPNSGVMYQNNNTSNGMITAPAPLSSTTPISSSAPTTSTTTPTGQVSSQQVSYSPYPYSSAYNPYSYQQYNPYQVPYNPYQYNIPTFSDENLKEDIKPGDDQIQSFLDAIKAHSYEYKDEKHGVGRFISPMAQELEKTELGKSAVIDTPEGKMVQYGRLGGITLAATAMLNERMNELEKKLSLKRK